jgi:hypothetical protein
MDPLHQNIGDNDAAGTQLAWKASPLQRDLDGEQELRLDLSLPKSQPIYTAQCHPTYLKDGKTLPVESSQWSSAHPLSQWHTIYQRISEWQQTGV